MRYDSTCLVLESLLCLRYIVDSPLKSKRNRVSVFAPLKSSLFLFMYDVFFLLSADCSRRAVVWGVPTRSTSMKQLNYGRGRVGALSDLTMTCPATTDSPGPSVFFRCAARLGIFSQIVVTAQGKQRKNVNNLPSSSPFWNCKSEILIEEWADMLLGHICYLAHMLSPNNSQPGLHWT